MSAIYVAGDLFAHADLDALAHGCNCVGSMGGGIALQFARRWPDMEAAYEERCRQGHFTLGDVFAWDAGDVTIFNLATQHFPGADARLDAVETALKNMVALAEQRGIARVGLPRIGAGIGGLSWPEVRAVIDRVAGVTTVMLVVFEEYRREV